MTHKLNLSTKLLKKYTLSRVYKVELFVSPKCCLITSSQRLYSQTLCLRQTIRLRLTIRLCIDTAIIFFFGWYARKLAKNRIGKISKKKADFGCFSKFSKCSKKG